MLEESMTPIPVERTRRGYEVIDLGNGNTFAVDEAPDEARVAADRLAGERG
jgi:hypothetical protein